MKFSKNFTKQSKAKSPIDIDIDIDIVKAQHTFKMDIQRRRKIHEVKKRRERAASYASCERKYSNDGSQMSVDSLRYHHRIPDSHEQNYALPNPNLPPKRRMDYKNEFCEQQRPQLDYPMSTYYDENSFKAQYRQVSPSSCNDRKSKQSSYPEMSPFQHKMVSSSRRNSSSSYHTERSHTREYQYQYEHTPTRNKLKIRSQSLSDAIREMRKTSQGNNSSKSCKSSPTVFLTPENSIFPVGFSSPDREMKNLIPSDESQRLWLGQLSPTKACHTKEETIQVFRRKEKLQQDYNNVHRQEQDEKLEMVTKEHKSDLNFEYNLDHEMERKRRGQQVLRELAFDFGELSYRSDFKSKSDCDKQLPSKEKKAQGGGRITGALTQLFQRKSDSSKKTKHMREPSDSEYVSQCSSTDEMMEHKSHSFGKRNESELNSHHKKRHRRYTSDSSNIITKVSLEADLATFENEMTENPLNSSIISPNVVSIDLDSIHSNLVKPILNRARTSSISNLTADSISASLSSIDSFPLSESSYVTGLEDNKTSHEVRSRLQFIHSEHDNNVSSETNVASYSSLYTDHRRECSLEKDVKSEDSSSIGHLTKSTTRTCSCSSSTGGNVKNSSLRGSYVDSHTLISNNSNYEHDNAPKQISSNDGISSCRDRKEQAKASYQMRPPLASPATLSSHHFDFSQTHHHCRHHILSDQSSYVSSSSSEGSDASVNGFVPHPNLSHDESKTHRVGGSSPFQRTKGIPTHIYEPSPQNKKKLDRALSEEDPASLGFADDECVKRRVSNHTRSKSTGSIPFPAKIEDQLGCTSSSSSSNAHVLSYSISVHTPDKDSLENTVSSISPMLHLRSLSQNSNDSGLLFCKLFPVKNKSNKSPNNEDAERTKQKSFVKSCHRRHRSCDIGFSLKRFSSPSANPKKKHKRRLTDTSLLREIGEKRKHRRSKSGGCLNTSKFDQKDIISDFPHQNQLTPEDALFNVKCRSNGIFHDKHLDCSLDLKDRNIGLFGLKNDQCSNFESSKTPLLSKEDFIMKDASPSGSVVMQRKNDENLPTQNHIEHPFLSKGVSNETEGFDVNTIHFEKTSPLSIDPDSGEDSKAMSEAENIRGDFVFSREVLSSSQHSCIDSQSPKIVNLLLERHLLDKKWDIFKQGLLVGFFVSLSIVFSISLLASARETRVRVITDYHTLSDFSFSHADELNINQTRSCPFSTISSLIHSDPSFLFIPFIIYVMTHNVSWTLSFLYLHHVAKKFYLC